MHGVPKELISHCSSKVQNVLLMFAHARGAVTERPCVRDDAYEGGETYRLHGASLVLLMLCEV